LQNILTVFSSPSTKTGNIFKLSEIDNWALAQASRLIRLENVHHLLKYRIPGILQLMRDGALHALFARRVAMPIWLAGAKIFERLLEVSIAWVIM
jgi:hypothetical protein